MTDKSQSELLSSKLIRIFLRDDQYKPGDKISWFIGNDGDVGTCMAIADYEKDKIVRYPLGWKTAAFLGYCLIQSAIFEAGYDVVVGYLDELASRRGDVSVWLEQCANLFKKDK